MLSYDSGLLMSDVLIILSVALFVVAVGSAAYWFVVLARTKYVLRITPYLREGLAMASTDDLVSVIVPAHNEAGVIAHLARSILVQREANLELIVVLDRCTDATREILEVVGGGDERLRLIENDDCPSDWAGKCNAARVGAEAARGKWLLFTDADVYFDTEVIRAAVAYSRKNTLDLLSAYTTLTARRWWERVVQPVAAVMLLRQYPTDRVNDVENPRSFANGQFMLFEAKAYEEIGGHAAVKNDLLEDIAFARTVHAKGGSVAVVASDGMIVTSMYPTLTSLLDGWKRIFIETTRRQARKLRQYAFRLTASGLGSLLDLGAIALGIVGITQGNVLLGIAVLVAGIVALVAQTAALFTIFSNSRLPLVGIVGWPLGCVLIAKTLLSGAKDIDKRRPLRWGGREYRFGPDGQLESGVAACESS